MDTTLKYITAVGVACIIEVLACNYYIRKSAPKYYAFWVSMAIIFVNLATMYIVAMLN